MCIDVTKAHAFPLNVAKQKAEQIAEQLKATTLLASLTYQWSGDTLNFQVKEGSAKGVNGHLRVTPKDLSIHIELPGLTLASKPWVVEHLPEYFASVGIV